MIKDIITDTSKFKLLKKDVTTTRQTKLQNYLLKLKKKGAFKQDEYNKIYPRGSGIARIYGLPKIHKLDNLEDKDNVNQKLKVRPIISSIGTYNYNLAKFLTKKLTPYIPNEYTAKDTFSFVKELNDIEFTDKYLISFDIVSLFSNIPLDETIKLSVDILLKNEPDLKINREELTRLFEFATAESHFLFEGNVYDQVDGVSMGSPLSPVFANIFMGHHEKIWLNNCDSSKPLMYRRYVDDIFCLFNNETEAFSFLEFLNKQHPNVKFTYESEKKRETAIFGH